MTEATSHAQGKHLTIWLVIAISNISVKNNLHIVCNMQTVSVWCLAVFKKDFQNNFWIYPFL